MANAELTAAAQVRFVIATVYRNNYLAGLTALSNGEALVTVLDYAQKWTTAIQWHTYEEAHTQIEASDGYVEPAAAEASGLRLRLPSS